MKMKQLPLHLFVHITWIREKNIAFFAFLELAPTPLPHPPARQNRILFAGEKNDQDQKEKEGSHSGFDNFFRGRLNTKSEERAFLHTVVRN
jgi:hypothetical protein